MKIYLAFKFTGEDPVMLDKELSAIGETLKEAGHEVFCSFWKKEKKGVEYNYCFHAV